MYFKFYIDANGLSEFELDLGKWKPDMIMM